MNLENGDQVSLWDRVKFLEGENGIVLFSIDDDQYSPCYPKEQWTLLKHGLMLDSTFARLVHIPESGPDMELLHRGKFRSAEELALLRKAQFDTAGS